MAQTKTRQEKQIEIKEEKRMDLQALGMVETRGLVASIEAADAMCKAADVEMIGFENTASGYISVLVEGDDANEPISDTVRGIIDGHIMLSRKVAARNHYPAIDILSSVSRLMNDIVTPEHKAAAGKLRRLLSVYESNRDLVSIGAYKKGTNPELDDALERIDRIYGFLQQKTDESFSLDEAVVQMIQATD